MWRWTSWLPGGAAGGGSPAAAPSPGLDGLRERMLAALEDCPSPGCERLRIRLLRARSAQELWAVRLELFQAVSHAHCQSRAVERIAALAPFFEAATQPL